MFSFTRSRSRLRIKIPVAGAAPKQAGSETLVVAYKIVSFSEDWFQHLYASHSCTNLFSHCFCGAGTGRELLAVGEQLHGHIHHEQQHPPQVPVLHSHHHQHQLRQLQYSQG